MLMGDLEVMDASSEITMPLDSTAECAKPKMLVCEASGMIENFHVPFLDDGGE